MKAEKLLSIVCDSEKMPGWNDGLSFMLKNASFSSLHALKDDELQMVAGGITDYDNSFNENDENGL